LSIALNMPLMQARLDPAKRPDVPVLLDQFGRVAKDLRISVTDRCNLRCQYCMPAEGVEFSSPDRILTDDEIKRMIILAFSSAE